MNSPLAALAATETALVAAIDAATARVDACAGDALSAALRRLAGAASAAKARLDAAGAAFARLIDGVGDLAGDFASMVRDDVDAAPALAAPEPKEEEPIALPPLPDPEPQPAPPMPRQAEIARAAIDLLNSGTAPPLPPDLEGIIASAEATVGATFSDAPQPRPEVAAGLDKALKNGRAKRKGVRK